MCVCVCICISACVPVGPSFPDMLPWKGHSLEVKEAQACLPFLCFSVKMAPENSILFEVSIDNSQIENIDYRSLLKKKSKCICSQ